jgi:2-polyprenyl-3-methyl-5-hydroxy-6-metoxy-1,4-benzoquinol methylase
LEIKKIWHQLSLKIGIIKLGFHLKDYINQFNKFLLKNIKLNSNSIILDIGCGRGKILGSLNSKLKLKINLWNRFN